MSAEIDRYYESERDYEGNGDTPQVHVPSQQERVGTFQDYIKTPQDTVLAKYKEELIESLLEFGSSGYSPEFAAELTDVVIVAFGLIHSMGLDFETLFDDKMRLNWQKYKNVPTFMQMGDSNEIAIARSKDLWNETHKPVI